MQQIREMLAALNALNKQLPHFTAGVADGSLPAETQEAFGGLLVELGVLVQACARDQQEASTVEKSAVSSNTIELRRTDSGSRVMREARPVEINEQRDLRRAAG